MRHLNLFNKKMLVLASIVFIAVPAMAGGGGGAAPGAAGIQTAADTIGRYWGSVKKLILIIGAIVGLVGAVRIYNKWTNGDQDINKEIVGWGGACLFLLLAPQIIASFFNVPGA